MSRATDAAILALGITLGAVGGEVLEAKPPQAKERPEEERLLYVEGVKKYVRPMTLIDGGEALLLVDAPSCVRRPTKHADCWRREPDGGARDFGVLNRFRASEAVGPECEPVACAVLAGEDADGAEDDKAPAVEDIGK